ncbi:peptide MFS transporter [Mobilicoccus pelagius]|uniref:Di-/tripeptide transporter n=1 Tax=Mobilicoccus pelagius NBRC 104925 TaxID=1089455 RepID=H5UUL4_9MICO|nr:oligopeptide:H+ symporter [Mobilicoccus pelagius]GAB49422.1 di-/tripeptide transporter [Mobilicoccus pelagius NBRC 104925]
MATTPDAPPPVGASPSRPSSLEDRGFLGHPKGLAWMFQVELWERFSYYGMKAILLYFIVDTIANGGMGISESTGEAIVATYGAAVYLLAIPGGIAADRLLGAWRSTLYGGIIIMLGHICLATPTHATAWVGICLVAFGTGFIKPNLSTMVGELYDKDDPRRDAGFQIFYMSINIGAFFSPLLVGVIQARWGYHAGFSVAAFGMGLAIIAFLIGRPALHGVGSQVPNPLTGKDGARLGLGALAVVVLSAALYLLFVWMEKGAVTSAIVDVVATLSIIAAVGYFATMFRSPKVSDAERTHLLAYLPLWVGGALFFMIFEQASVKMATFAKGHTQLDVGSFHINPAWYQSINPFVIVLLAPVIGWFFTRRAGRFPQTPAKFALAVTGIGLSAILVGWGFATWPGGTALAPFWFLALAFALQTVAELFLSPVGLSATTMLAPRAFASQAMALWLLTSAVGQGVAALLIKAMAGLSNSVFYYTLGGMTLVTALVLWFLVPWTQRKMQDIEDMRRQASDDARARRASRAATARH